MVPSYVSGGVFWVYFTGAALALAGIAFILNKKVKLAGYLLGVLLLIFVFTIHLTHLIAGDQMAMSMILKDTGLQPLLFLLAVRMLKKLYKDSADRT